MQQSIVFIGSSDPWVDDGAIPALCQERGIPCSVIPNANHSLETAELLQDIRNLQEIMAETESFIAGNLPSPYDS